MPVSPGASLKPVSRACSRRSSTNAASDRPSSRAHSLSPHNASPLAISASRRSAKASSPSPPSAISGANAFSTRAYHSFICGCRSLSLSTMRATGTNPPAWRGPRKARSIRRSWLSQRPRSIPPSTSGCPSKAISGTGAAPSAITSASNRNTRPAGVCDNGRPPESSAVMFHRSR